MKKIILTGASGQIGRRLAARLQARNDVELFCLSRHADALGNQRIGIREGAHRKQELVDADVLVHCAFARTTNGADLASSMTYSRRVFELACASGTSAIVNISSQSIYGAAALHPFHEGDTPSPGESYAVAKYATELLLDTIVGPSFTRGTHIRLASLIGDGMEERLVSKMVVKAMSKGHLTVQGGEQVFAFLDMNDAITGIECVLDAPADSWRSAYNLGPANSHTLLEIAQEVGAAVFRLTGTKVEINVLPHGSRHDSALDSSAFAQDFGDPATTSLRRTIETIICQHTAATCGPR